ncbi:hypothetical protein R50072_36580 [Simiduia litorea]|uniref:hypothetical protein n=1 Tax=Simiduia litorea TaxID=1435348 RepID=UPI0036F410AE
MKLILAILFLIPVSVFACKKGNEFPYRVKSLIDEPFTTGQCYPFEARFPTTYDGKTVRMAFVRFYSKGVAVRKGSDENAEFEAEVKISESLDDNESIVRLCLSADVAKTTVVELAYETVYPPGYKGPIAMYGPTFYAMKGFGDKLVENAHNK